MAAASRPAARRLWGWLIRLHRWLGVAGVVVFAVWFASGVVMVYHRLPRLSAAERLAALPELEVTRIAIGPAEALRRLGPLVETLRLAMLLDRPVYRGDAGDGRWTAIFADDGTAVGPVDSAAALRVAAALSGGAPVSYRGRLVRPDQWTLNSPIRRQGPLHQVAVLDGAGTELYVTEATGEAVMKTTRAGRRWGFAGAVLHWFFFPPLRSRTALWSNLIIYGALAGALLCLSGLVVGVYRLRLAPRYRSGRATPHRGWLGWHHYLGLGFGLVTFGWVFSGMLSMSPWDWSPGSMPTAEDRLRAGGGALDPAALTVTPAAALSRLAAAGTVKEVELRRIGGRPRYVVAAPPAAGAPGEWENTDLAGYLAAEPAWQRRLLAADDSSAQPEPALARREAEAAARGVRPAVSVTDQIWLDHFDEYYYHRRPGGRALPVLRTRFEDGTWVYFDPTEGAPVLVMGARARAERWLYHGLHSLDFPGLYQSALWAPLVWLGSIGGFLIAVAALPSALRRLGWRSPRPRPVRP